uniref:Uncharacterized protein n=1 Tax=Anguilla anguilla TaxID=7936 RepID=A0A0E9U5Q1_ANGAN
MNHLFFNKAVVLYEGFYLKCDFLLTSL